VCEDDNTHVLWGTISRAAQEGQFEVAAECLTWYWEKRGYEGGRRNVPNHVLYHVARCGSLGMLQWCREHCGVVSVDFCDYCSDVEGWERVVQHAAGAGHVGMVAWCLENGWEYTDDILKRLLIKDVGML